jgi:signal transduction histidine kinase
MAVYAGLDQSLRSSLRSGSRPPVAFYTEYLDLLRFSDERHRDKLVDYLQVKYSDQNMDLIFAVGPLALDFLLKQGKKLFPGTPVVFTSVNRITVPTLPLGPNMTGIAVKRDIRDTLDVALHIQPDTVHVVIPTGSSPTEQIWTEQMKATLHSYENRVTITYLTNLGMDEMLTRLKTLPRHTVVVFASYFFYDSAGQYFLPEEALELICRSANVPVYAPNESYLGLGIVGGRLTDLTEAGTAAGRVGLEILAGAKPADIPIQTLDPNHYGFDGRQLRRWGISESLLPPGSVVRFQPPSAWDLDRRYVLGYLGLVVFESALLLALVIQRQKLKQSGAQLKELSRHLINVQEEERKRIARELHDDFGQRLTGLQIELQVLTRQEWPIESDGGVEKLKELFANLSELTRDMQHLSHGLHSDTLQYLGLEGALKDLCLQIARQHRIAVDLRTTEFLGPVPSAIALCLYRVAQEGLNNTAKHSGASQVVIGLFSDDGLLQMRISDDGKGFNPTKPSPGLGLASMRERLRMLGGELVVSSKPGSGTELAAVVPVKASREAQAS